MFLINACQNILMQNPHGQVGHTFPRFIQLPATRDNSVSKQKQFIKPFCGSQRQSKPIKKVAFFVQKKGTNQSFCPLWFHTNVALMADPSRSLHFDFSTFDG
jgi:hypothetical protein